MTDTLLLATLMESQSGVWNQGKCFFFWPRWPRCPLFRFPSLALLSVCKREAWWCILKANANTPLWSLDAFQQCKLVSRHARWENYRGRTCHFVCERTVRRCMGFRLSTVLLPFQTISHLKILNSQTISKFDQNYKVKHKKFMTSNKCTMKI